MSFTFSGRARKALGKITLQPRKSYLFGRDTASGRNSIRSYARGKVS